MNAEPLVHIISSANIALEIEAAAYYCKPSAGVSSCRAGPEKTKFGSLPYLTLCSEGVVTGEGRHEVSCG